MTEREQFVMVLMNGPLYSGDAIVLLTGEDWEPRLQAALQLFRQGGGKCVVATGAIDRPPSHMSAERAARKLVGHGIRPDRVIVEPTAGNTHQQAHETLELAVLNHWKRILLVASSYHIPRAFLTFVQELLRRELQRGMHIVPVPAAQSAWWDTPNGMTQTRLQLLTTEYDKILSYRAKRHVATYREGMDYLRYWEKHA